MASRKLQQAKERARAVGLPGAQIATLSVSKKEGKRFSISTPSGRRVDFGSASGETFLDHKNEQKRKAWRARHSKIMRGDGLAHRDPESPAYYAWRILW